MKEVNVIYQSFNGFMHLIDSLIEISLPNFSWKAERHHNVLEFNKFSKEIKTK